MKLMISAFIGAALLVGFSLAHAEGIDNLFDAAIANPNFIATQACEQINIAQGERLTIVAEQDQFGFFAEDGMTVPVLISVPSQGHYVFDRSGPGPGRNSSEIVSPSQGLRVTMSDDSGKIKIEKRAAGSQQTCVLTRCAAFGNCIQ